VKLYLLRHAKSDWPAGVDDHERPLDSRGERAATLMGAYLSQRGVSLSLVLCSSARRTLETLRRITDELGREVPVRVERELYLASAPELLQRLRRLDDEPEGVLLVGHNPGLAELAVALAGEGSGEVLRRMREKFPTGALAELELPLSSWNELRPGSGVLRDFRTPKQLV
jgi:phosphohistidine phosphatase